MPAFPNIDPLFTTDVERPLGVRMELLPTPDDFITTRAGVAELLKNALPTRIDTEDGYIFFSFGAEHKLPNGDRVHVEVIQDITAFGLMPDYLDESYIVTHYTPVETFDDRLRVRQRQFDLTPTPLQYGKRYFDGLATIYTDEQHGHFETAQQYQTEQVATDLPDVRPTPTDFEPLRRFMQLEPLIDTYDFWTNEWVLDHLSQLGPQTAIGPEVMSWHEQCG